MAPTAHAQLKGGAWLIESTDSASVFTPEKLSDEHQLIAQTAEQFVLKEAVPVLDKLEKQEWSVARDLLKRCGELGLLGVDDPEEYVGLALDKVTSMVVSANMSKSASFAATFGSQANLTVLPLMLFGTPGQKQKYLPRLVTGELVGA